VDSLVIDPHKHGLQPYGCGCVIFQDPDVGALYKHDSPYTYFSSAELHLGEISLECSRAGASAVALWTTQRLLPLMRGGEFAGMLAKCREAACVLGDKIAGDDQWMLAFEPELDIVVWAQRGESASEISRRSRAIFEAAASQDLHLAVATFPAALLAECWPSVVWDQENVACLRSCLMKAEHRDWVEEIWTRLLAATAEICKS
ncbi:MAG: aspartate aminotransferase family protein, partial [Chloroflexi bacterium]|nr:aspartate aminotransferase family protein [Chloroflexota bacterium]